MPRKAGQRRTYFISTFVCCWLVLALTAPGIPIVWDEGEYFVRAKFIIEWFRLLPDAFSREAVQRFWLFINYAEGHPAGFALPIALTGISERVDSIRIDRVQDARVRRLPFQQKIGSGLTTDQFQKQVDDQSDRRRRIASVKGLFASRQPERVLSEELSAERRREAQRE